jgi:hypothetical protein
MQYGKKECIFNNYSVHHHPAAIGTAIFMSRYYKDTSRSAFMRACSRLKPLLMIRKIS